MLNNYGSAIIIAGGKGTRFREIYKGPKPLVPFINNKTLIDMQIENLIKYNIKDIHVLTGYKGNEFVKWTKKWKNKCKIHLYREENPMGSGGCLSLVNYKKLSDIVFVSLADILFDIDIKRFIKFHKQTKGEISVFVHPNNHPYDSDIAEMKGYNIIDISRGKDTLPNRTIAGLYLINRELIKTVKPHKQDLTKDIIKKWIKENRKVKGYYSVEYVKDAGTPERFYKVKEDYIKGIVQNSRYEIYRPAIFLDRDGVLNEYKGYITNKEEIEIKNGTIEGLKKLHENRFFKIVVTNQPVVARGECTIEELEAINGHLEYLLGKDHVFIDKLYYCPHHPDKGFPGENKKYKKVCKCRKPDTGMIEKALKEFPIDLTRSWVIGDSFRDIEMANRLSLPSILIITGEEWKNKGIYPTFTASNLENAVNIIINLPYLMQILSDIPKDIKNIGIFGKPLSGKTTIGRIIEKYILPESLFIPYKHRIFPEHKEKARIIIKENEKGDFNILVKRKEKQRQKEEKYLKQYNYKGTNSYIKNPDMIVEIKEDL